MKVFSWGRSHTIAVGACATLLIGGGIGAATADSLVSSSGIRDNSIKSVDIHDGGVHKQDLSAGVNRKLNRVIPQSHTTYVTKFGATVAPRAEDKSGLKMTGDGVQFGPFANGGGCTTAGQDYARLNFNGLNGKTLASVHQLDYTGWMVADGDTGGVGSLTMRIYLNGGADRLTFSPNTQYGPANYADSQGEVHTWLVTHGTLRLNDDGDERPADEAPWSHWVSLHGSDVVDHVDILLGCENGTNLQGLVRSIQANGTDYVLGRIG
jgi:hypothetical protein